MTIQTHTQSYHDIRQAPINGPSVTQSILSCGTLSSSISKSLLPFQLPCDDPNLYAILQTMGDPKFEVHIPRVIRCEATPEREYRPVAILGRGATCVCVKVEDWRGSRLVRHLALKAIPKEYYTDSEHKRKAIMNEIRLHKALRHAHIVGFRQATEDDKNVYVLTDLCEGETLKHLLDKQPNKHFSEHVTWIYMCQLVETLHFMHRQRLIHRDIKIANIFLAQDSIHLKLGDFGFACRLTDVNQRLTDIFGTPNYSSPDLVRIAQIRQKWKQTLTKLKKKKTCTPSALQASQHAIATQMASEVAIYSYSYDVDIWAAGICMYALLTGTPPFHTSHRKTTDAAILIGKFVSPVSTTNRGPLAHVSPSTSSIVHMMLEPRTDQRPSAAELLLHPYFLFSPTSHSQIWLRSASFSQFFHQFSSSGSSSSSSSSSSSRLGPVSSVTFQCWRDPTVPTHCMRRK